MQKIMHHETIKVTSLVECTNKSPKKRNSVTKRYPGKYYKHVYLNEDAYKIADLVAGTEGLSIKTATDLLVTEG